MALWIGIALALAVVAFARLAGLDRDRAFYPVVLIVVGSYYILFSAMAGGGAMVPELLFFALFAAIAVTGFRTRLWIVAAGLILHGLFDFTRHAIIAGQGVPVWWPAFCGGFDVAAGIALAAMLWLEQRPLADQRPR